MIHKVTDYALYRWRYVLVAALSLFAFASIVVLVVLDAPGGIRVEEEQSAIASGSLSMMEFDPQSVVDLPYQLLQRLSFVAFGVSELSIKLPSLVLGTLAALGIYLLVNEWFRRNVAATTTLIAATTPFFLFGMQDGTPMITSIAVSVWLLASATLVTRARKPTWLWRSLAFALFALNLYTPLGFYLDLAIVSTIIFHPHIRHLVRRLSLNKVAVGAVIVLVLLVPLLYSVAMRPDVGFALLGVPSGLPDIVANAGMLGVAMFSSINSGDTALLHPILSIGVVVLVGLGAYRFLQIRYTARSYIIWFWVVTLVPLLLINPQYAPLLFTVVVMMIAMGMSSLIREWYKLFPRNPYARLVGLAPLSVIVVGMVLSGASRYSTAYSYMPEIVHHYTNDISLLDSALAVADETGDTTPVVIVSDEQAPFYRLAATFNTTFQVSTTPGAPTPYIIHRESAVREVTTAEPARIFTSSLSDNSDRFYLYTK